MALAKKHAGERRAIRRRHLLVAEQVADRALDVTSERIARTRLLSSALRRLTRCRGRGELPRTPKAAEPVKREARPRVEPLLCLSSRDHYLNTSKALQGVCQWGNGASRHRSRPP